MLEKKNFSLSYDEKLHSQKDFNKVFKKGKKLENKFIKILAYKNPDKIKCRMALITSRKVAKAVKRNATKRKVREIFRTNKHSLSQGSDLIFILKPKTASANYNDLQNAILDLLKSAEIYQ
jgi:ribonuclease P protein component